MLLGIRKVPGSSLAPKTAYYETGFSDSTHSVQVYVYVGVLLQVRLRPHPHSFQKSFCQSTL